jgi:transcriptional regulator with XRE-family HTH domain
VTIDRKSPTVRRRRLGAELRNRRERAGYSLEYVAEQLECSQSKISRIETGHTSVNVRDVRDLLTIYRATEAEIDELIELAREARQKAWWHPFSQVLSSAYVGLEAEAVRVRTYEQQLVPGLLQTEAYARATMGILPGRSDEEISSRVRVRMQRQSLLDQEDTFHLWVVLDEAAVSRPVGGDEVMRDQLQRLVSAANRPNVTLQLLPFEIGSHAGMDGTFAILDFREPGDRSVVFAENATGGLFIDKRDELERYKNLFEHIHTAALGPEQSAERIQQLVEEPLWRSRQRGFAST